MQLSWADDERLKFWRSCLALDCGNGRATLPEFCDGHVTFRSWIHNVRLAFQSIRQRGTILRTL